MQSKENFAKSKIHLKKHMQLTSTGARDYGQKQCVARSAQYLCQLSMGQIDHTASLY